MSGSVVGDETNTVGRRGVGRVASRPRWQLLLLLALVAVGAVLGGGCKEPCEQCCLCRCGGEDCCGFETENSVGDCLDCAAVCEARCGERGCPVASAEGCSGAAPASSGGPAELVSFSFFGTQAVDLMLVIDNSVATQRFKLPRLQAAVGELLARLRASSKGLPDLHLGTLTGDLGAGPYDSIPFCSPAPGDAGVFGRSGGANLGETCLGPGQRYLVDVQPPGCDIARDASGLCLSHGCSDTHCEAAAGGTESLALVDDDRGCPRCRNYVGELEASLACLLNLPGGCGFQQPLEAVMSALTTAALENEGFLRDDAHLGLLFWTDQDDCSAADPVALFDPSATTMESVVGPLSTFRCFEFGVDCRRNDRLVGPRIDCLPREDPAALLHPIGRLSSVIDSLKDPDLVMVAALAGPWAGEVIDVEADELGQPRVAASCNDASDLYAYPPVRLRTFVSQWNRPPLPGWAYSSHCEEDHGPALAALGQEVVDRMGAGARCTVPGPLAGCVAGPDADEGCLPDCAVYAFERSGTEQQKILRLPWCGHVCREGLCQQADISLCVEGSGTNCECPAGYAPTLLAGEIGCASLYFTTPVPAATLDPILATVIPRVEPAAVGPGCPADQTLDEAQAAGCWFVRDDCAEGQGVNLGVVWASPPPPSTEVQGTCWTSSQ